MKYPDFVEQLIIEKEYTRLTPAEKQQVGEWVDNEAEYTAIRGLLLSIDDVASTPTALTPSPNIKAGLQQAFQKKHGKKPQLTYTRSWVVGTSVAASLALLVATIWVFNRGGEPQVSKAEPPKTENREIITDNRPRVSTKTETPVDVTIDNQMGVQTDNGIPQPAPQGVDNTNSVTAATYPDLNELMITVF